MTGGGILVLAGCTSSSPELTVLAASSLTDVFTELEAVFEAEHTDIDVRLAFAGSQTLATQVHHGLSADVFASADLAVIRDLSHEGLVDEPRPLALNRLVLAFAPGQPAKDLEHLPEVGILVVGDPNSPIGAYTEALFEAGRRAYGDEWRSRVEARVASREPNVRLALAKVAMGEADAAVVYATDVVGSSKLGVAEIPDAPTAAYHHARVRGGPGPKEAALAWMSLVEGDAGRRALLQWGFTVEGPQ